MVEFHIPYSAFRKVFSPVSALLELVPANTILRFYCTFICTVFGEVNDDDVDYDADVLLMFL